MSTPPMQPDPSPSTAQATPGRATLDGLSYDEVVGGPHLLEVVSYHEHWSAHECRWNGRRVLIDLMIAGTLPQETTQEDLIGKTISVEYAHGFVWIASEPRIVGASALATAALSTSGTETDHG